MFTIVYRFVDYSVYHYYYNINNSAYNKISNSVLIIKKIRTSVKHSINI